MSRNARNLAGSLGAALSILLLATPAWAQVAGGGEEAEIREVQPPDEAGASASGGSRAGKLAAEALKNSGPRLTLAEVLESAADEHPTIKQAEAGIKAAEAQRKQARGSFGPSLTAEANAQLWNEELAFDMAGGGDADVQLPPPQTPYEQIIYGMFAAPSEPTTIRSQFTWSASLTLTQPLSPLWMVYHGYKAAALGEESAKKEVTQAERDQAKAAAQAYFQLLQAQAALDTELGSVERLEAQLKRMDALVEAGAAMRADKLRLEVALAASQQSAAKLKSSIQVARSALAVAIGLDPSQGVGAEELGEGVSLPNLSGEPDEAVEAALDTRPELEQLRLQQQQVERSVKVEQGNYIPQVVAMAQYTHTEGQGLSGSDAAFVGLAASWDIWKWGADYYGVDAVQAQGVQLDYAYEQARRQIGLQVRAAWYDLQSSVEAYEVASKAVGQAEEAYRIESVRYEAGESTPTDLLDAQGALTEAENNKNAAFYQTLIQNAELIHATGRPLTVDLLIGGVNP